MPLDANANLARFEELLQWFLERVIISDEELAQLVEDARRDGWLIANHAQARMVQDAIDAAERAEEDDDKHVASNLASKMILWWGSKSSYRLRTTWTNAVQRAYNRGRYNTHRQPGFDKLRPVWVFDAILDSRTTVTCRERDGIALPPDDPWWQLNYPPLHHHCRSGVRAVTEGQVDRRRNVEPGNVGSEPSPGFGNPEGELSIPLDDIDPVIAFETRRKQSERS